MPAVLPMLWQMSLLQDTLQSPKASKYIPVHLLRNKAFPAYGIVPHYQSVARQDVYLSHHLKRYNDYVPRVDTIVESNNFHKEIPWFFRKIMHFFVTFRKDSQNHENRH